MRFAVKDFFPMSRLKQERRKISINELPTRKSNFLQFVTQALCLNFKKLIVTSPTLLRGLHQMSILKMVPEGLKPQECEQIKLRKPPLVPYVPLKNEVQDEVARVQSLEIKRSIKKDTTLNVAVWQEKPDS
jgi:hypothetical protein